MPPDPSRGSRLWRSLVRPPTIFYRPSTSKLIDSPASVWKFLAQITDTSLWGPRRYLYPKARHCLISMSYTYCYILLSLQFSCLLYKNSAEKNHVTSNVNFLLSGFLFHPQWLEPSLAKMAKRFGTLLTALALSKLCESFKEVLSVLMLCAPVVTVGSHFRII